MKMAGKLVKKRVGKENFPLVVFSERRFIQMERGPIYVLTAFGGLIRFLGSSSGGVPKIPRAMYVQSGINVFY